MLRLVQSPVMAQGPILSGCEAVAIARTRFANLCGEGILPRNVVGTPFDLDDVEAALAFLSQCRKTEAPTIHSVDLRRAIGGQLGATIAAASALGFGVYNWYGTMMFGAHAKIGVNRFDVRRVTKLSPWTGR
jgi:hypothetical protein